MFLLLGLVAAALRVCAAEEEFHPLSQVSDLQFDADQRLDSHWLLYSYEKCAHNSEFLDTIYSNEQPHRPVAPITGALEHLLLGNDVKDFTSSSTDSTCSAILLERGVLVTQMQNPIPEHTFHVAAGDDSASRGGNIMGSTGLNSASKKKVSLLQWLHDATRVEIGWISYMPGTATLYWISDDGRRVESGRIAYGEKQTLWIQSHLGHRFEIVGDTDGEVWWTNAFDVAESEDEVSEDVKHAAPGVELNDVLVKGVPGTVVRTERDVGVRFHCVVALGSSGSGLATHRNESHVVRNTLLHEWQRSRVVKRTFTPLGFSKGRLPVDLYTSISTYYHNNAHNLIREEWDSKGVFVNWWQADVYMIGMPWDLKRYWQSRLQPLVEAWIGGHIKLELTDIYGMRRYEDGASLLPHVDREETHSVSMIVNVAQGAGLTQPWPVEIYDHADRLHEIVMEPGDIVYYESAKCLHARVDPLQGGYYVNFFTHYRPDGDPQWFLKENPPDAPKPLLDIGECTVVEVAQEEALTGSQADSEAVAETCASATCAARKVVKCTKADLPTLSPSLEVIRSGEDLYDRWQRKMENHKLTHGSAMRGLPHTAAARKEGRDKGRGAEGGLLGKVAGMFGK